MKTVLNYVWLANKGYYDPEQFVSKAPIPAEFLNNVIRNYTLGAVRPTWLWCDYNQLGEQQVGRLRSYFDAAPMVSVKNLNDITLYQQDPLFKAENKISSQDSMGSIADVTPILLKPEREYADIVWKKVDLLRLIVLDHVLEDPKIDATFYSDMDAILWNLNAKKTKEILHKDGILFCRIEGREAGYLSGFENAFLGLHRKGKDLLPYRLIPLTRAWYKEEGPLGDNGHYALWDFAQQLCVRSKCNVRDRSIFLKMMGERGKRIEFDKNARVRCVLSKRQGLACG